MDLLTIVPGDKAIHRATGTVVQVMSYADGRFDCRAYDGPGLTTAVMSGPVDAFEPYSSRTPAPKAADPALSATATEIARLQAQVADLQKKLQAAELLAHPAAPVAIAPPRMETQIARNVNERWLARTLNEGWTILHMQFVGCGGNGELEDRLNVVLQRHAAPPPQPQPEARAAVSAPAPVRTVTGTVIHTPPTPPQPEQRAAVVAPAPAPVRTVTGTVVPLSQQIGDDDEYEAEDVPPLPALDPDPLMPTASAADFTKAVLAARLSTQDTLNLLNDRLKSVARDAYTAFPAPAPYKPLGAVK